MGQGREVERGMEGMKGREEGNGEIITGQIRLAVIIKSTLNIGAVRIHHVMHGVLYLIAIQYLAPPIKSSTPLTVKPTRVAAPKMNCTKDQQ